MDGLRLALLIIGVVIVAIVYWSARRRQGADIRNSEISDRIEPVFDDIDQALSDVDAAATVEPVQKSFLAPAPAEAASDHNDREATPSPPDDSEEQPAPAADQPPQKVITFRVIGKDGGDFPAEDVVLTLRAQQLEHGRFGIFHRNADGSDGDAVFSVANLTEPGTFDLQDLRDRRFAGLTFFMLRPGPGRGVDAFDKMVEAARAVAISLQGELLDGEGSTLSIQRERFLREDLIQYELKHLKL